MNVSNDSVDAIFGITRQPTHTDSLVAPLDFPDGNIVLKNWEISMRVHTGILALHSRAFNMLFDSLEALQLSENPPSLTLDVSTSDLVAYIDAVYNRTEYVPPHLYDSLVPVDGR